MNHAPSYEELKNYDELWFQVTPYIGGLNETFDGASEDKPITSFVYYEAIVSAIEDGVTLPFSELRINISERNQAEMEIFSEKYPIGFLQFYENSVSASLVCRTELVSRMVYTLGLIKTGEIEFLITIPKLPNELPNAYPIINYQFRAYSKGEIRNA